MNEHSDKPRWTAVVLAAGRGAGDPLARHFNVSHKCLLPVAGTPMLQRVVAALSDHSRIADIVISIEDEALLPQALGALTSRVAFTPSQSSAATSAAAAARQLGQTYPILLTTADHALLDTDMVDHFIAGSDQAGGDLTVGLATAETILSAYPDAKRTFLQFGADRVSGCNLYGLNTELALRAIDLWQRVEANRKNPLAIAKAFGLGALLAYITGRVTLQSAFALASRRLQISASPVLMPFAHAAIDVDKPADKDLVEDILGKSACSA